MPGAERPRCMSFATSAPAAGREPPRHRPVVAAEYRRLGWMPAICTGGAARGSSRSGSGSSGRRLPSSAASSSVLLGKRRSASPARPASLRAPGRAPAVARPAAS
jgi:hypothetical protein